MVEKVQITEVRPGTDGAPAPPVVLPKRSPGHRGADVRDTVAEMAAKAQEISQEAGSKVAAAMKDVISAAAGLSGFAIESARDLVQYMVRRGQMTQDEADKLIREAEAADAKRNPHPVPPPSRVPKPAPAPERIEPVVNPSFVGARPASSGFSVGQADGPGSSGAVQAAKPRPSASQGRVAEAPRVVAAPAKKARVVKAAKKKATASAKPKTAQAAKSPKKKAAAKR